METEVIKFVAPYKIEFKKELLRPIKQNEVLIKTLACGICMRETLVYSGYISDRYPVVMGHEAVGIVMDVGTEVKSILPGDYVTAIGEECLARHFIAEGIYVQKIEPVSKIENLISEPAMCVISAIRASGLEPGDNVLVTGCGFMGLLLIQALNKTLSNKIIVTDLHESRLDLALKFGADKAFLANEDNLEQKIDDYLLTEKVDIVFEASGTREALLLSTNLVKNGGTLCLFGHQTNGNAFSFDKWHYKGIRVLNTVPWMSKNLVREFRDGTRLLENGVFKMDELISHRFDFYEAEEALRLSSRRPQEYIKSVILM